MTLPKERPDSWNAKMLSGAPLILDEQFERLLANAPNAFATEGQHNPVPVVKIFLPHAQWILVWIYPNNLDRAFAVARLGAEQPEAGDVLISTIAASRLGNRFGGVLPERDKYITLDKPWRDYLDPDSDW